MSPDSKDHACAGLIHDRFQEYQDAFGRITRQAPQRFARRQWKQVQTDTMELLNLYTTTVDRTENDVRDLLAHRCTHEPTWIAAHSDYAARIADRVDRPLAETFFNSVTRRIFGTVGINRRIEFVQEITDPPVTPPGNAGCRSYPLDSPVESAIRRILADADKIVLDPAAVDAVIPSMARRIRERLGDRLSAAPPPVLQMLPTVFFRGQGAYLIGRIVGGEETVPLVIALLHPPDGIVVDALLLDADAVSIVFSYTRSAFHVFLEAPCATVGFLQTIMPSKPEAEIYSAIGHFKHGKTVLFQDVCRHTAQCTDRQFDIAPGKRGMVMVVFDLAGHEMVVKLIRDRFDTPKRTTRAKVIQQYDFVFNHYRVGRLIEAHAFERLSFDRCWFADGLLDHLIAEAGETVHLQADRVVIDHAYLERRVTPLDIYLQAAGETHAAAAVVDFGRAIKDLALANIFPGDMLLKNFGVTRHRRVVFYDYDEIVPLTDCRFRSIPKARNEMEEMAAEPWYMIDENDVFPEEFSRFLGLSAHHRDLFLQHHADLLAPDFWLSVQSEIAAGHIGHIRPYRPDYQLTVP